MAPPKKKKAQWRPGTPAPVRSPPDQAASKPTTEAPPATEDVDAALLQGCSNVLALCAQQQELISSLKLQLLDKARWPELQTNAELEGQTGLWEL